MNRNRRNIIIAILLLIALLIFPFWPKVQQAMGDGAGETAGACWTDCCL